MGRYGGKVLYRHTVGELWGGLRAVLGRFWVGFGKVLEGKRGVEKSEKIEENPFMKAFISPYKLTGL